MYGEDRWKIWPWYLESLALWLKSLALGSESLLKSLHNTIRAGNKSAVHSPSHQISDNDWVTGQIRCWAKPRRSPYRENVWYYRTVPSFTSQIAQIPFLVLNQWWWSTPKQSILLILMLWITSVWYLGPGTDLISLLSCCCCCSSSSIVGATASKKTWGSAVSNQIVFQVNEHRFSLGLRSQISNMMPYFQDGGKCHDVTSRRKVLPSGDSSTRSICPVLMKQRPVAPDTRNFNRWLHLSVVCFYFSSKPGNCGSQGVGCHSHPDFDDDLHHQVAQET